MVHLDRENAAILLPDNSVVPYDVLVIGTGLQVNESRLDAGGCYNERNDFL